MQSGAKIRHPSDICGGFAPSAFPAPRAADGDGWTNIEEYLNGTNPTTANDPMQYQTSEILGDLSSKGES
jgi:hypothetical protein